MAWDEGHSLTARFDHVHAVLRQTHPHWKLGRCYSGFTQALRAESPTLVLKLKRHFQRLIRQQGPAWTSPVGTQRRPVFAVDGTRLEAPRTAANEQDLGCAGREKTCPQVYLTMLWHVGTGLPWDYRVGPGTDSERTHLKEMLPDLPAGALLLADAGFISHELCRALMAGGRDFVLRVGGNVTLLTELGYSAEERAGVVYLWPDKARRQPPQVLRLIVLRNGKVPVYLVTNLLQPEELSDEDVAALYELRWGEEVYYRGHKQTLDRGRLLSRRGDTCLLEGGWTVLGIWLLGLLTVTRLVAAEVSPQSWSLAASRDAVRCGLRDQRPRCGLRGGPQGVPRREACRKGRVLGRWTVSEALRRAVKDSSVRHSSKPSRNPTLKKRDRPPGPPKIKPASPQQIQAAKFLALKLQPP